MKRIVRWIHVSDWHIKAKKDPDADKVLGALLKDMKKLVDSGDESPGPFTPDFIAHTGDVAFSGKTAEYRRAAPILQQLLSITHLGADRLFIVPGNHDVDEMEAIPIKDTGPDFDSKTYLKFRDDWYQRPGPLKSVLKRFHAFQKAMAYFVPPGQRTSPKCPIYSATITTACNATVDLFGVTSPFVSHEDDQENKRDMILGSWQIENAADRVRADGNHDLRIVLLHHPIEKLKEYDRHQCFNAITDASVNLLLRGHVHSGNLLFTASPDGAVVTIAAGSSYDKRWKHNGYVLGQVDLDSGATTAWFRKWEPDIGCFKPDAAVSKTAKADGSVTLNLFRRLPSPAPIPKKSKSFQLPFTYTVVGKKKNNLHCGNFGIFPGHIDLDSHIHMAERIAYQLEHKGSLETKYLFWHVDSRSAYSTLVDDPNYTIARHSESLFRAKLPEIGKQILALGKSEYTIVSLGAGAGVKEFWLLRELCMIQPKSRIHLVLVDINDQMLKWALDQFRGFSLPEQATVHFCSADFDRLANLKPIISQLPEPVVYLLLGGLFGNLPSEKAFLMSLMSVAKKNSYFLSGFQTPDAIAYDKSLGGYGTQAGFNFLDVTISKFDNKYDPTERSMKPALTGTFPGDISFSETITVAANTPTLQKIEIGFSRRYKHKSVIDFVEKQGCKVLWKVGNTSKTYYKFLARVPGKAE